MIGKMFIPKNEYGVLYLFARFHEKLGFEEVVDISQGPPDIIAKKNGKEVRIELEFKSSNAFDHYLALRYYRAEKEDLREGKWIKDGNDWTFVLNNGTKKYVLPDPQNECRLDENREVLLLRTAKKMFDIIVCWEKDELFEENMGVIELKKALTE